MPSSEVVFSPPKADSHAMAPHAHVMTISSFISKITTVFKQQLIAVLKLGCIIT